jgi:hypothetical protein
VWNGKRGNEDNSFKGDDSLKSFLFTLKNPSNTPAKKFALTIEYKHRAIKCIASCGPEFGTGGDIAVSDDCDANCKSHTYFGLGLTNSYVNTDTSGYCVSFLMGSSDFRVKEIEVFEITD